MAMTGFAYKRLINYFLQGLLVVAPLVITAYTLFAVINWVDSLVPIFSYTDSTGQHVRNYGLGFVIIIAAIVLIGFLSSFFITSKIYRLFDKWLEKTPGIKHIYSTTRDFFEAFAGDKKKFTKSVLANVDDNDVWRVGFVTKDDMEEFGMKDYVAVYIPTSYSVAGSVYIVKPNRIKPIKGVTAAQSMKFALSGGVADIGNEEEENLDSPKTTLQQLPSGT